MPNYAPRITLPYHDVSGVVELWAKSCDKMAVFQHEADEEVNSTHVHMIMINCKYKSQDTLCNQFRKLIETERKGNGLWSWEHKHYPNPDEGYITYMSNGRLTPMFLKNFTENEVAMYSSRWKQYNKKHIINDVNEDTQVVEVKIKQKTKWELLCIMDHEIKLYQKQHPNRVITKEIRNRIIVNVLKEEKQVIGLYKVQEFSYAFSLHFDTETFIDALNDSMKC